MCQNKQNPDVPFVPFSRAGMSGADSPIPSIHQQLPLNWVPNKVKAGNNREQNKDWERKDPEGNTKTTTWAMRWWMKKFLNHCGVKWRPWPCHYQHWLSSFRVQNHWQNSTVWPTFCLFSKENEKPASNSLRSHQHCSLRQTAPILLGYHCVGHRLQPRSLF